HRDLPSFPTRRSSDLIFCPMFQVGCFSACSTVISENFSAGVSRNGPPDAVRMMRRTSETSNAEHRTPNAEVRAGLADSAFDVGRDRKSTRLNSSHVAI